MAILGVYGVSVVLGEARGRVVTDGTLGLGKRFRRIAGELVEAPCVAAGSRRPTLLKAGLL